MNPLEVLTVEDLMDTLQIGKNKAYELLNSRAIKAARVGRVWRIPLKAVVEFLENGNG